MKISKSKLMKIIREELATIQEDWEDDDEEWLGLACGLVMQQPVPTERRHQRWLASTRCHEMMWYMQHTSVIPTIPRLLERPPPPG